MKICSQNKLPYFTFVFLFMFFFLMLGLFKLSMEKELIFAASVTHKYLIL